MGTTFLELVKDSQKRFVIRDEGHFVELNLAEGGRICGKEGGLLCSHVLNGKHTAWIKENALDNEVVVNMNEENGARRSRTCFTSKIPMILLTIIVFPSLFGLDGVATGDPDLFLASITPEVGTSTSSYTGTLLWPVAQIFRSIS